MSKKTLSAGSSTPTSVALPTGGRVTEMVKQDKAQGELTMIMQGIHSLQQKIEKFEEKLEGNSKDVRMIVEDVRKIDRRLENIQQRMEKQDERLKRMEEKDREKDEIIGNIENRVAILEQDSKEKLIWEMERAEFYLRFQNIEEEKEEKEQDLATVMIKILAEALGITEEKMKDSVDGIYRVFTRYAQRKKLPREIHVRFTKKTITAQILQVSREKTLRYKDKEIVVLKQIPRRVRERRREYRFLTKKLMEREVNYRWLIPEGLMFTWQGQRRRIASIDQAEIFYKDFSQEREAGTEKESTSVELQEDQMLLGDETSAVRRFIEFKGQREMRATRAVNPKYKA